MSSSSWSPPVSSSRPISGRSSTTTTSASEQLGAEVPDTGTVDVVDEVGVESAEEGGDDGAVDQGKMDGTTPFFRNWRLETFKDVIKI